VPARFVAGRDVRRLEITFDERGTAHFGRPGMDQFRAAVIGPLREAIPEAFHDGRISGIVDRLFDATPERRRRALM
jgi:hypothetical protein